MISSLGLSPAHTNYAVLLAPAQPNVHPSLPSQSLAMDRSPSCGCAAGVAVLIRLALVALWFMSPCRGGGGLAVRSTYRRTALGQGSTSKHCLLAKQALYASDAHLAPYTSWPWPPAGGRRGWWRYRYRSADLCPGSGDLFGSFALRARPRCGSVRHPAGRQPLRARPR